MARILIADDSEVTRKLLAATLGTHEGWTVCGEAVNGRNAILMAHDLKPDLVVMDLVMPMLDGLQAAAEIAKGAPAVPIVIYSLQILPELEIEAKKYGVWAMVSKSADRNVLIETVERLLASTQPQLPPDTANLLVEPTPGASTSVPTTNEVREKPSSESSTEPE